MRQTSMRAQTQDQRKEYAYSPNLAHERPLTKPQTADDKAGSATDSEYEDETGATGISRSKLQPDHARDRFDTARVDASSADFSDRVAARKGSYKTSTKRRPAAELNGPGDALEAQSSEDESEEGLARRVARLKREIEEIKVLLQQKDAHDAERNSTDGTSSDIISLSRALETVHESQRKALSAHARLQQQLSTPSPQASALKESLTRSKDTEADVIDSAVLQRIAAFDTRLASLECALGLDSLDIGKADTAGVLPVLPTLSLLDQQIALLVSADSVPNVDAKLAAARAISADTSNAPGERDSKETGSASITQDEMEQLRALTALLPTVSSLGPTIDPLIARLHSLRHLHTAAATADQHLADLEKRQDASDKEITQWRDGLEKLRSKVEEAEAVFRANAGKVEELVAELESKFEARS